MFQPKEYEESRALSQSDVKLFRRSILAFYEKVEMGARAEGVSNKSTEIGDLVDCMRTNPKGLDNYYIAENVACSEAIRTIVITAYAQVLGLANQFKVSEEERIAYIANIENYREPLIKIARENNYQKNYKDPALLASIISLGGNYLTTLAKSDGKPIIDRKIYLQARECDDRLMKDSRISKILDFPAEAHNEILKQYVMFGEHDRVRMKGLLDWGIVNHNTKIVWPYDLKTTFQMSQFMRSYFKLGYGYQGSYYTYLLQQIFPGYDIRPFSFIVVATETTEAPLLYKMAPTELALYADGGYNKQNQKVIGWKETISEIAWHRKEQKWLYPRNYYDKGHIVIDSIYSEEETNENPL